MKKEGLRILLLEDEKSDELLVKRELNKVWKDCYLKVIEDKKTLKQLLKKEKWDLVITDYLMPQMDGLDTLRIVRLISPSLPVILISGTMGEEIAVKVIKAGADDYILKDKLHRLNPVIERVLEDYERRKHLAAANIALKESHLLSEAIIKDSPLGVVVRDRQMRIIHYNSAWQRIWGFSDEEIARQRDEISEAMEIFYDYAPGYQKQIKAVFEEGKELKIPALHLEKKLPGRAEWIAQHFFALKTEEGKVLSIVSVTEDISKKKENEKYQQLKINILETINNGGDWKKMFETVLKEYKEYFHHSAYAVRLKDGDDFPYFISLGFDAEFLESERSILNQDENSARKLDCLCGRVISADHNSELPYFNDYGSFWTNDLKRIKDYDTEVVERFLNRGVCLEKGYNSVALIPFKVKDQIVGLLQINDHKKDKFSETEIRFLEESCRILAISIQRKAVENRLIESEQRFREIIENSQDVHYRQDFKNGKLEYMSPSVHNILGYTNREVSELTIEETNELFHPEDIKKLENFREELVKNDIDGNKYLEKEFRMLTRNGDIRYIKGIYTLVKDDSGNPLYISGVLRDKTVEREALISLKNAHE